MVNKSKMRVFQHLTDECPDVGLGEFETGVSIAPLANKSQLAATNATPGEFAAAVAIAAQQRIAEGLPTVPPPRNVKELAAWVRIHRESAGLDSKQGTGGGLVQPVRNVTRQPVTIDVENADCCIEDYEV